MRKKEPADWRASAVAATGPRRQSIPATTSRPSSMSSKREHLLGCDEMHGHTPPKCCRDTCWCHPLFAYEKLRDAAKEAMKKMQGLSISELRELKIAQYASWTYGQVNLSNEVPVSRVVCEKAARDYLLVSCPACAGYVHVDGGVTCARCEGYGKILKPSY